MQTATATKRKTKKQIESEIEAAFSIHFNRVQIPMFDIPKIFQRAREIMALGFTADHALETIVLDYK